jgi:hypothetical protein
MNYSEITSDYIKTLMFNSSWQDHKRIDDLICLRNYILNPPRNWSGGMAFTHLKTQYRAEYLDLLREHSPDALAKVLREEQAINEKRIKLQTEYDAQEMKEKSSWLLAGGKP